MVLEKGGDDAGVEGSDGFMCHWKYVSESYGDGVSKVWWM